MLPTYTSSFLKGVQWRGVAGEGGGKWGGNGGTSRHNLRGTSSANLRSQDNS